MNLPDAATEKTTGEGAEAIREREYKRLYLERQWFALRDEVVQNPGQSFYRDVVICIFHGTEGKECPFAGIFESEPHGWKAYEAHRLLSWMHLRQAEFRKAIPHLDAMAEGRQASKTLKAGRALFAQLATFSQQSVDQIAPSVLPCKKIDGNLFVPVAVNRTPAYSMLDSGASFSFTVESEAIRLGMQTYEASSQELGMYAAAGDQTSYRIGIAARLEIGNSRILNVPFLILKDAQFQFPAGHQTALGLPVLLALGTLNWQADGNFLISAAAQRKDLGSSNLCFDAGDLVVEAAVEGSKMILLVDTGCAHTLLWPPVIRQFAPRISLERLAGSTRLHGISGVAEINSFTLPVVELEIAGRAFILNSARVLTKPTTPNSKWLSGLLGSDLLEQMRPVSLDFEAMTLSVNDGPR